MPAATIRRQPRTATVSRLTPPDLKRAIFLDFESFKDGPPLLAGTLIDGVFKQIVLDERLRLAATCKGIPFRKLIDFVERLVEKAESEARNIVGFSTKERNDIRENSGHDVSSRYVNMLTLAKKWRKRFHGSRHEEVKRMRERMRRRGQYINGEGNRLTDFANIIGFPPSRCYGHGHEASRLRYVIGQLMRRGRYEALTPVAKAKWTKALKHNDYDVRALEILSKCVANDLATIVA
jgi:hypothetical protein